jgi:hypothetical protein
VNFRVNLANSAGNIVRILVKSSLNLEVNLKTTAFSGYSVSKHRPALCAGVLSRTLLFLLYTYIIQIIFFFLGIHSGLLFLNVNYFICNMEIKALPGLCEDGDNACKEQCDV